MLVWPPLSGSPADVGLANTCLRRKPRPRRPFFAQVTPLTISERMVRIWRSRVRKIRFSVIALPSLPACVLKMGSGIPAETIGKSGPGQQGRTADTIAPMMKVKTQLCGRAAPGDQSKEDVDTDEQKCQGRAVAHHVDDLINRTTNTKHEKLKTESTSISFRTNKDHRKHASLLNNTFFIVFK